VFIYKLVASNTVEEKIIAMQQRKQLLADDTLGEGEEAAMKSLTADEIMALFEAEPPNQSVA